MGAVKGAEVLSPLASTHSHSLGEGGPPCCPTPSSSAAFPTPLYTAWQSEQAQRNWNQEFKSWIRAADASLSITPVWGASATRHPGRRAVGHQPR